MTDTQYALYAELADAQTLEEVLVVEQKFHVLDLHAGGAR